MSPGFDDHNRKRNTLFRTVYDYTMGVLWMGVGAFFLFHEKFGFDLRLDTVLTTIFGISSLLYGAFRIYRGFQASKSR